MIFIKINMQKKVFILAYKCSLIVVLLQFYISNRNKDIIKMGNQGGGKIRGSGLSDIVTGLSDLNGRKGEVEGMADLFLRSSLYGGSGGGSGLSDIVTGLSDLNGRNGEVEGMADLFRRSSLYGGSGGGSGFSGGGGVGQNPKMRGLEIISDLAQSLVAAQISGSRKGGEKHTIQYRDNPETIKALNDLTNQFNNVNKQLYELRVKHDRQLMKLSQQYQKQLEQLDALKDPAKIEKAEQVIFKKFVDQLISFDIMNLIPKPDNARYFATIGEVAAGKTSIYNKFFGLNQQVGVDETTQTIAKVHQDYKNRLVYWDYPGFNQCISITNPQCLKAFYSIDCVFIITAVTFKNSIKTIQIMDKINPPKLYLVRNHCDKFETEEQLQQAAAKDRALLKQYKIKNVKKILYVSMLRGDSYRDNKEFKTVMTTKF